MCNIHNIIIIIINKHLVHGFMINFDMHFVFAVTHTQILQTQSCTKKLTPAIVTLSQFSMLYDKLIIFIPNDVINALPTNNNIAFTNNNSYFDILIKLIELN